MIKDGIIQEGKSYLIDKTPTMYDPLEGFPFHKWIIDQPKFILIETPELEQSFSTLQNWRNLQISKLIENI